MSIQLAQQRCLNHLDREAVARCPECAQFYCRECIVEHDDRVLCAACLRRLTGPVRRSGPRLADLGQFFCPLFGIVIAWIFYYLFGQVLLTIPTSFHEGVQWLQ
jgi:hypothetical protein